jgi:hypothetical protein
LKQRFELAQLQQKIPSVKIGVYLDIFYSTVIHKRLKNVIPEKLAGKRETYTLFTMVTTASRISPLNGLNTTHWYLTGNVTNPVPSRINPFPMFSMPVIATTNPCRPLQECRNFFIMVLKMPFFFTDLLFPGSPNIQAIKYIMNLNSLLLFFSFQKPTQYQILRSFYHQNDPNNNKEKTLTLVQLQLQWIN